jgi:hypothetical protein
MIAREPRSPPLAVAGWLSSSKSPPDGSTTAERGGRSQIKTFPGNQMIRKQLVNLIQIKLTKKMASTAYPGSLEAVAEELFLKVKTAGRCTY